MILEEQVRKTLDWRKAKAVELAKARAHLVWCQEYRKSLRAILFTHEEGTVAEREAAAYADPKYLAHLDELKEATQKYEELRNLVASCDLTIEAWRTEQANIRKGS